MLILKPFIRTVILSTILAALIIYLGIKYHWSDYLKANKSNNNTSTLVIPPKEKIFQNQTGKIQSTVEQEVFTPEILPLDNADNLISSMNKEQVTQHCKNLLSKSKIDGDQLSLAIVNCTVSNYQESHQTINDSSNSLKRESIYKNCQKKFVQNRQYTNIEKQLLVGICTSDRLAQ